jgi:phosphoribosylaminoimidazolecarboxamide formyltransferase/IMP cyclohydrolase
MKRALISVTDKTGVVEFARGLEELGFSILSTGGTYKVINQAGVSADEIAGYTGFPEMMDGRIKTLHPKVHGGILARRDQQADLDAMSAHQIDSIEVVAVNLYPFRETAKRPGVQRAEVIENIDIGGPAMIRSAAKNHGHVAVVVDSADYDSVLENLRSHEGRVPVDFAMKLAAKAFAHTASYDVAIATWFDRELQRDDGPRFGDTVAVVGDKLEDLRYGENPHQQAALFAMPEVLGPSLASARKLSGKALSYNNLLDLDAALGLALEFTGPACVIVKHNNPCGTGLAETPTEAFLAAIAGDPVSAFGGIVALNRVLDVGLAEVMVDRGQFLEAVVAPQVDVEALGVLQQAAWGKNLRVLELGGMPHDSEVPVLRQVSGGFLLQTRDALVADPLELKTVTKREPKPEEMQALSFAWRVCKHVHSNAIVLARGEAHEAYGTVGVGAGQMSRVDAVKLAVDKAGERSRGSVLASDAFFPFADGLEAAAAAGVSAAIQPGGSRRDQEVIVAADKAGLAMVFTGRRHFRH